MAFAAIVSCDMDLRHLTALLQKIQAFLGSCANENDRIVKVSGNLVNRSEARAPCDQDGNLARFDVNGLSMGAANVRLCAWR